MSPPRTGQGSLRRRAAASYRREAKDRRIKKGCRHRKLSGGATAALTDDALTSIFARLPDTATVVRCVATCRRWGRVVATSAAVLSRSLPPLGRFLPDLAVGLFHQEKDWPTTRGGLDAASSPRPCFVATASGGRFLRDGRHSLGVEGLDDSDGLLDHSRPVASRNGRLVLELRSDRRQDRAADGGLRLAICNPMTRDSIVLVPPLVLQQRKNKTKIPEYGCALLTGHDLSPPRCHAFFRILLVYNHNRGRGGRKSTVLRCYSSDTGRWGPETESNVKIRSSMMRSIGPAVVRRGVAFWALEQGVFGVRLDQNDHTMDMHLVPFDTSKLGPNYRLMGISPDNRLFLMYCGYMRISDVLGRHVLKLTYLEFPIEDDIHTGKICPGRETVLVEQMVNWVTVVTCYIPAIKLWWFGEKSGTLLVTMGEQTGCPGTYMLNLRNKEVDKVGDDVHSRKKYLLKVVDKLIDNGHSWKNLVGYEMDMAAYLASVSQTSFPS